MEGEWREAEGSGGKRREAEGSGAEEGEYRGEEGRGRQFLGGVGREGTGQGDEGRRRGYAGRWVEGGEEAKGVSDEVPTHACAHVAHRAGSLLAVCGVYLLVQARQALQLVISKGIL